MSRLPSLSESLDKLRCPHSALMHTEVLDCTHDEAVPMSLGDLTHPLSKLCRSSLMSSHETNTRKANISKRLPCLPTHILQKHTSTFSSN